MARNTEPIVKQSRREGVALHPKAHKVLVKRNYAPGQHGRSRRRKPSRFALQLREKQKAKRMYGLLEKQFQRVVKSAEKQEEATGLRIMQLLEKRLDNAVYRSHFANSRRAARQLVNHGHFELNGKRIDIPSALVKPGDVITVRDKSKKNTYFQTRKEEIDESLPIPGWLNVDHGKYSIKITGEPSRDDMEADINEQLIVEFYSR